MYRPMTVLLGLSGLAASTSAQTTNASTVIYSLSWSESDANGLPAGNGNGILEPGEHALFRLVVQFSNQNRLGSYGSSPPGTGTIRGFGGGFLDLQGTSNNGGNAQGSWNLDAAAFPGQVGTNPTWDLIHNSSGWGTPGLGGAHLSNIQMGQAPATNAAILDPDPVPDIWTGVWTPSSYSARTVRFDAVHGSAAGNPASVVFATSTGPVVAYLEYINTAFGSVQVPIVPAPAGCLILAPLLSARRRRRTP